MYRDFKFNSYGNLIKYNAYNDYNTKVYRAIRKKFQMIE